MTDMTFRTPDGIEVPSVTADEMREVDRLATEEFGIDLPQMMENAGRNLAWHAREMGTAVTVVAGNGGNGGGGMACARHLHNRDVPVRVVLDRPPADLEGAAAHQYAILDQSGVPVDTGPTALGEPSVLVDALIGYGLTGAVRGPAAELVEAMNDRAAPVLSLDIPSGRNATTGETPGEAVDPARVLTLALPKTGLRSADCPVSLADISLPVALYERLGIDYETPFKNRYWVKINPK
ncbi:NAD(P)H-hydrate epimerase [Halovenus salina]|uniref:NAD(P)H-hydrate epimerase n=1 Tax=Halovenus salina TaxID=1510225 RepID=A0ABD5W2A8_9EURY|nr:NAD(P)H-hydrate epimerase [Halovenus salina]